MDRVALAGWLLLLGGGLVALVYLTALTFNATGPKGGVFFHLPTLIPGAVLFLSGVILLLVRRPVGLIGGAGEDVAGPPGQMP